ncbi:MAG: DUF721 domain-containing protein [Rubricoccaceae bacterium]|nr:DUF721 domain-containing protein [Rubricoccaceae bacterium]
MATSNSPQPLGKVLGELIDKLGYRDRLDAARAVEAWPKLAGPTISDITESVWMRSGTMYIKLRSSAWRHQLHMQREGWRKRINEHLGHDVVDEVVFR